MSDAFVGLLLIIRKSMVQTAKFFLRLFVIKFAHFNSFSRVSMKKNNSRRKVRIGVSYTGILTRDEY
jgi:hypothetical protein